MSKEIPYKIYLEENEMPRQWYNLRADMKHKPAPLLNPATLKPMTADDLRPVFCDELIDILHIVYPNSALSYSKGSRGLFVPLR